MGKRKVEGEHEEKAARQRDPLLVAAGELAKAKREKERLELKVAKLSTLRQAAMDELQSAGEAFDKAKAALTGE